MLVFFIININYMNNSKNNLLFWDLVTVTYAHHSLIQGNRKGALYGLVFTIVLALIFTIFQGVEYTVSSFTISDGIFGSCFYFGTGLNLAPINNTNNTKVLKKNKLFTNKLSPLFPLSPYWVTGFSDAEGSFSVKVGKDPKRKHGIRIIPVFILELHKKDKDLLVLIQTFFGVGTITEKIRKGKPSAIYTVHSINDLTRVIIPHFKQYSLLTQKKSDFLLFCSVVDIMVNNKSLTYDNILEILAIKASINTGLSNTLKETFFAVKEIKQVQRPVIISEKIESSWWLIGFVEGDGNFYVKVSISQTLLVFSISQHSRDTHLMNLIKSYLNCGRIETPCTRAGSVCFIVSKYEDILKRIIPLFEPNLIRGIKRLDFKDFCKIATLMNDKKHLTQKGKKQIMLIKQGMNTGRKL